MIVHYDCRYFLGHKPCKFRRECAECPHHSPFGERILIIKLGAMGDVLRTTPLLRGLRGKFPGCHITWLTEPSVLPMLQGINEIDRLLGYSADAVIQLEIERFARLYVYDKEPKASALAMKLNAPIKVGFGMSEFGNIMPLNQASEYTFELGINDPLKFRTNTKTYPQLIYECAGLPYPEPQEYLLPDFSAEISRAGERLHDLGVNPGELRIGLNTGAGDVFATKKWTEEGYAELASRLVEDSQAKVLLLGGPGEGERNSRILKASRMPLVDTGTRNPIREFTGLVGNCDLMVTGDTLAMHIAIGLGIPVLVILGATCHQEIELYGRGAKIISDFECSPCYLRVCPKETTCMEAVPAEQVFGVALKLIESMAGGVRSQESGDRTRT